MAFFTMEQMREFGKEKKDPKSNGGLFVREDLEELENTIDPKSEGGLFVREDLEKLEKENSDVEELKDVEKTDEECEECEELPSGLSKPFGFSISDHLDRIQSLLDLLQQDIDVDKGLSPKPLMNMIEKMMAPGFLKSFPLSDVILSPLDEEDLGKIRGKITMMTGKQIGDEPMKIRKKTVDIEDEDTDTVKKIKLRASQVVNDMRKSNHKFASISDLNEYVNSLKLAYRYLNKLSYNPNQDYLIIKSLHYMNPSKFAGKIDSDTNYIINGVISDISLIPPQDQEAYQLLADRVKVAYHNLLEKQSMTKQAYFRTKEEGSISQGFNLCPKYKTVKGEKIPVAWDFCQRDCIEGRVETNGDVHCKYAYWLENIADSHAKVMEKLDVHRNPNNDDVKLNLPDGKKAFAPRGYLKGTEQRIEEAKIRGRSWDDLKKSKKITSGASGKMLNLESLMDEILTDKDIHRDQSDSDKSYEQKLRTVDNLVEKSTEQRLYNTKEEKNKKEEGNIEARISDNRKGTELDYTKLMDELIEQAYPRKEAERPQEN